MYFVVFRGQFQHFFFGFGAGSFELALDSGIPGGSGITLPPDDAETLSFHCILGFARGVKKRSFGAICTQGGRNQHRTLCSTFDVAVIGEEIAICTM
ncbi:hypothetical protein PG987_008092 [Apiospora arundinis]